VIALDIAYSVYAANQAYYREAFTAALAAVTGRPLSSIYVTNFQRSSVGTTIVYFDTILQGTDYDVVSAAAAVQALFCPPAGTAVVVGTPACPPLLAALAAAGLPAAGAYYNDMQVASNFNAALAEVPISAGKVGTWRFADSNEVVVLDLPYSSYAANQQYFKEAFTAGMAQALGVVEVAVFVNDFQQSPLGNVLLYFDVALPATSSSAIPVMFAQVAGLFQACNGAGASPVGCPAGAPLISALQQFGLPITQAYYNQENAPAAG